MQEGEGASDETGQNATVTTVDEVEGVEGLLAEVLKREPRHAGALSALGAFLWQVCVRERECVSV